MDDATFDAILDRLADGESLRAICKTPGYPHRRTVEKFLASDPEAAAKCARARESQGDVMDEKQLEIVADMLAGKVDAQAARVAVSVYQWRAAKLAPKRFGDKVLLGSDPDNPIPPLVVIGAAKAGGDGGTSQD
jgi:hypothetical protein